MLRKLTLTAFSRHGIQTPLDRKPTRLLGRQFFLAATLTGRPEVSQITCRSPADCGITDGSSLPPTFSARRLAIWKESALCHHPLCWNAVHPLSRRSRGPIPGWQPGSIPAGSPATANWCVLPRCTVEFEKTTNGCKIHCRCDDEVARGTLQNLCRMLADGLCSCCCTCNGIPCCQCNFTVGICKCEYTKDGCCISCTSRRQGLLRDDSSLLRLPAAPAANRAAAATSASTTRRSAAARARN